MVTQVTGAGKCVACVVNVQLKSPAEQPCLAAQHSTVEQLGFSAVLVIHRLSAAIKWCKFHRYQQDQHILLCVRRCMLESRALSSHQLRCTYALQVSRCFSLPKLFQEIRKVYRVILHADRPSLPLAALALS